MRKLQAGPTHFLTAHFHNWEHMGAWMTRNRIPLISAARPLADTFSQNLLVRLRNRLGMKVVVGDIPRRAIRHLKEGGCFALLWDQRVPESETVAPLFGHPLAMDPLPRFLTRHTPVPVFFGVLLPGGRFRLLQIADPDRIREREPRQTLGKTQPLDQARTLTKARTLDPYRHLGRRYHRVLECLVRAYPTHWYGLAHGRFQGPIHYGNPIHVSRETSVPSGVMVSRETKLSD